MSIEEMYAETVGYKPHSNSIDVRVAIESTCNKGHHMEYFGFKQGESYRAFAVCKLCDIAEEF